MREIRFQMWNKLEKRWMDSPIIDGSNGKAMSFSPIDGSFVRHFTDDEVEIVQSTEYLDKSGAEIYEGDYVVMTATSPIGIDIAGIVKADDGCWVIESKQSQAYLYNNSSEIEVLDNIYENPKLLDQ